ncbi:MAG: response regulator [Scytonema sp. PMC 1069.18]|nr:response regulator [Scytonema sp. PMC 1069.18]MEC4886112.1 response regulator [Scytonema sp. PMC 1070.18]
MIQEVKKSDFPTVLLVEDEPADVFRIQRAVSKANLAISLEVVSDGEQAVLYLSGEEAFQNRDRYPVPVLILLDLKLPRLSGFEVLAWLRESELKHLPVAVLSSSEEQADIERAYALGANSYLTKPVDFNTLLEMVRTIGVYWVTLNRPPHTIR